MKKKIILFGGTFNPIHNGHIFIARYALEKVNAQKIIFIPARRSPHKREKPTVSDKARLEMIRLAVGDEPRFEVSDCELRRPEPSYTIDTINAFKAEYGEDTELYWLIGADTVKDLDKWYKIGEIIDLCNLTVICRAGFVKPDFGPLTDQFGKGRVEKLSQHIIEAPLIDVSSSEIRQKLDLGKDVGNMIAPQVREYIAKNKLYKI